jgi:hypothetical protein
VTVLLSLIVIVHLLGMAGFVAAYGIQRQLPPGTPLVSLWAWCVLVMTLSGFALIFVGTAVGNEYSHVKMISKGTMMTIIGVTVLWFYFRRRGLSRTLPSVLAGLVVAEVAVSVLID